MANPTFLQLVNSVQRRLRETVTASVTTTSYSTLLGDFVNEAKREVEDAWNWNCLRDTIIVSTVASTPAYVLTNARNRFRVLDVYNDTTNHILKPIRSLDQTINLIGGGSSQTGLPTKYSFNGEFQGDPIIDLFPVPDGVYAVNFNLVIPQADLLLSEEELIVPAEPVILGAYLKALGERGEDTGDGYARALQAYTMALSTAIAQDESRLPGETTFYAV